MDKFLAGDARWIAAWQFAFLSCQLDSACQRRYSSIYMRSCTAQLVRCSVFFEQNSQFHFAPSRKAWSS